MILGDDLIFQNQADGKKQGSGDVTLGHYINSFKREKPLFEKAQLVESSGLGLKEKVVVVTA